MNDLIVNLLASVIAGVAVWVGQRLLRHRRVALRRSFLGVERGSDVVFFVSRHASSNRPHSVHKTDVAALLEVATAIKEVGGRPTLVTPGEHAPESGRFTEYCVGGPTTNPRTAAYLRSSLPGVRADFDAPETLAFWIGDECYRRQPGIEEFALLARITHPTSGRPVFLIVGQVAPANLGVARYLVDNVPALRKTVGVKADFCLVLRVREPGELGPGLVELVADRSVDAFQPALSAADQPL